MNQKNPQLIRAAVIIFIIAGLTGALSVLVGNISPVTAKISALSILLIIFGITGTLCMVVTVKPAYKALGMAGMAISALGFVLAAAIVLAEIDEEGILKLAFAAFILSIALAHICLLHHFHLQNKYAGYARIAATIAITIFSFAMIIRVFEPFNGLMSFMYNQSSLQLVTASLIVDLAATLLVPLCNRLELGKPVQHNFTEQLPVKKEAQIPSN